MTRRKSTNNLPDGFTIACLTVLVAGSGIGFTLWFAFKLIFDHAFGG